VKMMAFIGEKSRCACLVTGRSGLCCICLRRGIRALDEFAGAGACGMMAAITRASNLDSDPAGLKLSRAVCTACYARRSSFHAAISSRWESFEEMSAMAPTVPYDQLDRVVNISPEKMTGQNVTRHRRGI